METHGKTIIKVHDIGTQNTSRVEKNIFFISFAVSSPNSVLTINLSFNGAFLFNFHVALMRDLRCFWKGLCQFAGRQATTQLLADLQIDKYQKHVAFFDTYEHLAIKRYQISVGHHCCPVTGNWNSMDSANRLDDTRLHRKTTNGNVKTKTSGHNRTLKILRSSKAPEKTPEITSK